MLESILPTALLVVSSHQSPAFGLQNLILNPKVYLHTFAHFPGTFAQLVCPPDPRIHFALVCGARSWCGCALVLNCCLLIQAHKMRQVCCDTPCLSVSLLLHSFACFLAHAFFIFSACFLAHACPRWRVHSGALTTHIDTHAHPLQPSYQDLHTQQLR